jgi:UDP-N-acetylmuramoyl-L-alanyl-D-glutamate--2,6-diaminopimelate ligase
LRLSDLIAGLDLTVPAGPGADPEIAGLTADSRQVKPGYLFAALAGSRQDGRRFIDQALAAGAAAVLADGAAAGNVPVIASDNPRRALAKLAARFYGRQPRCIAAVTGTNGKTSVAAFTRQIWARLGLRAASLGTLGLVAPDRPPEPSLTTPDPVALHAQLAALAADGVDHLAIEASSHGLDQYRLDGVKLAAAGFTNLTRDHLDYHKTMEAYFAAKVRLFERVLPRQGCAVLNADSGAYPFLEAVCRRRDQRVISFGTGAADLALRERRPSATGQDLTLSVFGATELLHLPLAGGFQALNALCALGLVIGSGAEPRSALAHLERLDGVRGRLELAATTPTGAPIYVDYAHTPDALETVLEALRPHADGQLVVVFGCGGDRDPGKRPLMGEIAARRADRVVVTDDNPRSEDPAAIRRAVLAGCARAGGDAEIAEIGERADAIAETVESLRRGDVLVVAGKGHEQGQIVGDVVRPFDDADVVRAAVAALAREGA